MLKHLFLCLFCGFAATVFAQQPVSSYKSLRVAVRDSITLDSVPINPANFIIRDDAGMLIDTGFYRLDAQNATLHWLKPGTIPADSVRVEYETLPDFLTKTYRFYAEEQIVSNDAVAGLRLQMEPERQKNWVPFEGLNTSGSITRGITVGNNQNTVTNSSLDLQISGQLAPGVNLRASIQDNNIPLQQGGYSQKLDEFDQIFVELYSDRWNLRAGDLFLENRLSRFLNFNKKVQGLSTRFDFGKPDRVTSVFAAASVVRGQYTRSTFTGTEGNQGPYKLRGPAGELYVLVISGSERVYVNGILLTRGENRDYVIDYNAGEITFTSLFPITSEMRINIEYQYAERNYTRLLAYGGAVHKRKTWSLGTYVYSENDIKNQPLAQNLSVEQTQILAAAGDDPSLMYSPSAYADTYSENKILYRKVWVGGVEVFEFSNNPDDALFNVRFLNVGQGNGNYTLANAAAVGRIYEYAPPLNGVLQGSYEPIVRLVAPAKIQLATVLGSFVPNAKTRAEFEVGMSNSDQNLFSSLSDDDNQGVAAHLEAKQRLATMENSHLDASARFQYVSKNFRTVERLFSIEFDRDWNLQPMITGGLFDQSLLRAEVDYVRTKNGALGYRFEKLDFEKAFTGQRHLLRGGLAFGGFTVRNNGSFLNTRGTYSDSEFLRNDFQARYHWAKNWIGASHRMEDNQEVLASGQLSALSQRFSEYGFRVGRGDSTKVFVEIGYLHRVNDSLQEGRLTRVNHSQSYYLKSKLLQSTVQDLSVFASYRRLVFAKHSRKDEPSLNSRLLYNGRFFEQMVQVSTAYETAAGTIAQQEFTYLEVEPGQGVYTWNDYNNNGIQEIEEFEVALFTDQARFLRIFLPNQVFLPTHMNKWSQSVILNPTGWQNKQGVRRFLSRFYMQTSFLSERKIRRDGTGFDLNPIGNDNEDLLGLNASVRNSVFYNRGKQRHSVTYTYLDNKTKVLLNAGAQEGENRSHQWLYQHLVQKSWLFSADVKTLRNRAKSQQYASKDYLIKGFEMQPKVSYLFSKSANVEFFYDYRQKNNEINERESLEQHRWGTAFNYASERKFAANGEFSFYDNQFSGNANQAAGYYMLEGLQGGKNLTWRLLLQKNLTQYLDLNINYQGRKTPMAKAVHTGSIQLRAFF